MPQFASAEKRPVRMRQIINYKKPKVEETWLILFFSPKQKHLE